MPDKPKVSTHSMRYRIAQKVEWIERQIWKAFCWAARHYWGKIFPIALLLIMGMSLALPSSISEIEFAIASAVLVVWGTVRYFLRLSRKFGGFEK